MTVCPCPCHKDPDHCAICTSDYSNLCAEYGGYPPDEVAASDVPVMKRHLPRGRWTLDMLTDMGWHELTEISRYKYRGTKKWAKRRIHKMERQRARREIEMRDKL